MDDERFYELIRSLNRVVLDATQERWGSRALEARLLIDRIEREIRDRVVASAVDRENERIALVGPGK